MIVFRNSDYLIMVENEFKEKLEILNENFLYYFQEARKKNPNADFVSKL